VARSPHRCIPQSVADQPRGVRQQSLALGILLLRGSSGQFVGQPAGQRLRSGPLTDCAPGCWRGLVDVPESRIAAGRRLPEVEVVGVEGFERGSHDVRFEAGPRRDVGDRDHETLLEQGDCRIEHRQIPGGPGILHEQLPNRDRAGDL